jgi:hypothetical protein
MKAQWNNSVGDNSGIATGGLPTVHNFEICLNPLRNWGVTLIRFHGQLIIRNLITEDAGIFDNRIMML